MKIDYGERYEGETGKILEFIGLDMLFEKINLQKENCIGKCLRPCDYERAEDDHIGDRGQKYREKLIFGNEKVQTAIAGPRSSYLSASTGNPCAGSRF